jgi:protein tyrosine phosphatase (PTP) superfamily phosphohydrolase (DUF442 family)
MEVQKLACTSTLAALLVLSSSTWLSAQTKRETFPGLIAYWRIDATASNGSRFMDREAAIPELARRGFKAVVNVAGGPEAEAEGAAVRAAGMKYFVMEIGSRGKYDPTRVDPVVKVMSDRANQPVFIHSGNGHRTAMLWMIKRVLVDRWSIEQAGAEATTIGLINDNPMVPILWQFAREYIEAQSQGSGEAR